MTISETTYRCIEMMLPDEATIEKLGAAYESGDHAELGRLMAAYIGEECRKTDALWSITVKGLMTAAAGQPDPAAVGLAQMNAAVDKSFDRIIGKLAPESRL